MFCPGLDKSSLRALGWGRPPTDKRALGPSSKPIVSAHSARMPMPAALDVEQLAQRAACNQKTIEHQLQTRAMLQQELERLLEQLKLQQCGTGDGTAASSEPAKRKRPSALDDDTVAGASRPSMNTGFATPTDTESSRPFEPIMSGGQPSSSGSLSQVEDEEVDILSSRFVIDCDEGCAARPHALQGLEGVEARHDLDEAHDDVLMSSMTATAVAHGESIFGDEDESIVYRSLPAAFDALGDGAPLDHISAEELAEAAAHTEMPSAALAPQEHEGRLPPPPGAAADETCQSGGLSVAPCELMCLLAQAEALKAELDEPELPSLARLSAMLETVRTWAEIAAR